MLRMLEANMPTLPAVRAALEKWSRSAPSAPGTFARFLAELDLRWECPPGDIARIPLLRTRGRRGESSFWLS